MRDRKELQPVAVSSTRGQTAAAGRSFPNENSEIDLQLLSRLMEVPRWTNPKTHRVGVGECGSASLIGLRSQYPFRVQLTVSTIPQSVTIKKRPCRQNIVLATTKNDQRNRDSGFSRTELSESPPNRCDRAKLSLILDEQASMNSCAYGQRTP